MTCNQCKHLDECIEDALHAQQPLDAERDGVEKTCFYFSLLRKELQEEGE